MPSVTCFSPPAPPLAPDSPRPDDDRRVVSDGTERTDVGPHRAIELLTGLGFEFGPAQPLTRWWLDTFDGRLAAAGARLDARPVYKPGSADAVELCPHGAALPDRPLVVERLPRLPTELPAGQFRLQLGSILGNRALLVQTTMRSDCAHAIRRNRDGKAVARVELHTAVEVDDGDGLHRPLGARDWCLELHELAEAGEQGKAARRARRALLDLGLADDRVDALTWAAHAAGIATGSRVPPRTALRRGDRAREAWSDVLHDLGDVIGGVWDGAATDVDPEFLHDLRTSLRRARSLLRDAAGVLPDAARHDALDLAGALADRTGEVRDLDVQLAEWATRLDGFDADERAALEPVRVVLDRRRRDAQRTLAAELDRLDRASWLTRWHALVDVRRDADGSRPDQANRRVGKVVADRVERAHRRLVRDGRSIGPDTPVDELHTLRKDAKRLRSLVDAFGSLVPGRHRRDYVARLKVLLDHLGAHQDAVVQQQQLASLVLELDGAPAATCAAVRVMADEADARAHELRAAFEDVFAGFDRRRTRRALDAVLDDLRT